MKKILTFATVFLALIFFFMPGMAADLPLVSDEAQLLSNSELAQLIMLAEKISDEHDLDLAVYIAEDMGYETDSDEFAQSLYFQHGFGRGDDKDGVIFILSMQERDWAFYNNGKAQYIFRNFEYESLNDEVLPKLSQGNYYDAFLSLYDEMSSTLDNWSDDDYSDKNDYFYDNDSDIFNDYTIAFDDSDYQGKINSGPGIGLKIALIIFIPLLIAGIVSSAYLQKMKTTHVATTANQYLAQDGLRLTWEEDRFTHETKTTRIIQRTDNNNRGDSGHSASPSSFGGGGGGGGGRTGGSGKF